MPILEPKDGVFIGIPTLNIQWFLVMCFCQSQHQSLSVLCNQRLTIPMP